MSRIPSLVSRLVNVHGWRSDRILPNVASRLYETAVGPKQASVWFTVCKTTNSVYFWPEYQSEGRNAAGIVSAWVTESMSDAEAAEKVDQFVQALDACISQTYAVRPLHSGVAA